MAWQQMFGTDISLFGVLVVAMLVVLAWSAGRRISSTRDEDVTEGR